MKFPEESFVRVVQGIRDSVRLSDFIAAGKFHVLIFMDGDCGGCIANLNGWKTFFDRTHGRFHSVLIVSTGSVRTFEAYYDLLELSCPVLYDPSHTIRRMNGWMENVVLIDDRRQVLLEGDPLGDSMIKRQYKRLLNKLERQTGCGE